VSFINQNHKLHRPFFLYLPHLAIHFPWQGPNDPPHRREGNEYFNDKWGIIPEPGNVAPHVKAMVEALDQSVGEIVATLEVNGLRDNTLLVFTSDNGGYTSYGKNFRNISSNAPFRGQKAQIYEGGHRVPLIISWPGVIPPATCDELAFSADFFPTFAELAGIGAKTLHGLDGVSLMPTLTAEKSLPQRTLYWRMGRSAAVRRGPWKLCIQGESAFELYRLDRDPGEESNLAEKHPEKVRELNGAWQTWNTDVNESAKSWSNPRESD
jgi:arylsulfatase A-like enzyme